MTEITFVGTGEALDPELPNSSVLYQGKKAILVDCGYAVPHALWRVSDDPDLLDAIYLTHVHADHAFGLPAVLLKMREDGRTRPLPIIGGSGTRRWLKRLLDLAYPGSFGPERGFPIEPVIATPGRPFDFDGVVVRCARSRHVVRNLSVRFDAEGGAVCISGDGAPTPDTLALYRGADLLVHECYEAEPTTGWHANVDAVLSAAREAGVARVCLLHVGRDRKAEVRLAASRFSGAPPVDFPRPGDRLTLGPGP